MRDHYAWNESKQPPGQTGVRLVFYYAAGATCVMFLPSSEREGQFRPSWLMNNAGREKWPGLQPSFEDWDPCWQAAVVLPAQFAPCKPRRNRSEIPAPRLADLFRGRRCAICLLRGCGEQASDGGKDKTARGRDGPAVEVLGYRERYGAKYNFFREIITGSGKWQMVVRRR